MFRMVFNNLDTSKPLRLESPERPSLTTKSVAAPLIPLHYRFPTGMVRVTSTAHLPQRRHQVIQPSQAMMRVRQTALAVQDAQAVTAEFMVELPIRQKPTAVDQPTVSEVVRMVTVVTATSATTVVAPDLEAALEVDSVIAMAVRSSEDLVLEDTAEFGAVTVQK